MEAAKEYGVNNSLATSSKESERKDDSLLTPFEWVTNFSSLSKILDPSNLFNHDHDGKVLHVGCGSSTLGELILKTWKEYRHIVNIDIDIAVLEGMKKRYSNRCLESKACDWFYLDFSAREDHDSDQRLQEDMEAKGLSDSIQAFDPSCGPFDLVVDKSTLDCALCSDDATSGLICLAHDSLTWQGVYICVTFHHKDFIMPLLRDCPGVDWSVECIPIKREVDDLKALNDGTSWGVNQEKEDMEHEMLRDQSAWIDGIFSPDSKYGRSCNVMVCRRVNTNNDGVLDRDAVRRHVHDTNDMWFQNENPMVTHMRKDDLKILFDEQIKILLPQADSTATVLPLKECYDIMFTEAEKEHYSYDYFLEDWKVFCKENSSICVDGMGFFTAVDFLAAMQ